MFPKPPVLSLIIHFQLCSYNIHNHCWENNLQPVICWKNLVSFSAHRWSLSKIKISSNVLIIWKYSTHFWQGFFSFPPLKNHPCRLITKALLVYSIVSILAMSCWFVVINHRFILWFPFPHWRENKTPVLLIVRCKPWNPTGFDFPWGKEAEKLHWGILTPLISGSHRVFLYLSQCLHSSLNAAP